MSCPNIKIESPKPECNTEFKTNGFSIKNGDIYRNGELFAKFIRQEGDIITCEVITNNRYMKGQRITIVLTSDESKRH